MFRFYLDNTLVSDPINWADFSETIERDEIIKGLLPKYDIKLNFTSGGYDYLYSQYLLNGFCKLVELKIDYKCESGYSTILRGYIFISDCKFNLNKCLVECSVIDNNFGAMIYNNKSIKSFVDTTTTKNGETLTACAVYNVQFFTPTTGNYSGATRKLYAVNDLFRWFIEFMTDNKMGFESTFLSAGTLVSGSLGLITGDGIRNNVATSLAPFTSFEKLFSEVNKKYPIAFTIITGTDGRPTMKIEDEAYFFNQTSVTVLNNIQDLKQSFNNEILYSSVKFGGNTVKFDIANNSFAPVRFLTFQEEQYFLNGTCNIDKTLDLYGEYIADSNIIEELFATNTSNDSYDEDIFFIQSNESTQAVKYASPSTLGVPYYYNGNLTNDQVSSRYNYNGSLALYLSGVFSTCFVRSNVYQAHENVSQGVGTWSSAQFPVALAVEVNDPGGNFASDKYTAPDDGLYVFKADIITQIDALSPITNAQSVIFKVRVNRYDSANVLLEYKEQSFGNLTGMYASAGIYNMPSYSDYFNMIATDYLKVEVSYTYKLFGVSISTVSYWNVHTDFRITSTPSTGGVIQDVDTRPYRVSKFEFEQPLSNDKYNTLKLDLSKGIDFDYKPLTQKTGWIRKITRKYSTGETNWELISNITNSN